MKNKSPFCTLTNQELIEKATQLIQDLIDTGGKSWVLNIPARPDSDPDLIFTELNYRFKNVVEAPKRSGAVWVKENIVKVLEWAEKFYSENGEQLMLDENEWYVTIEDDDEIGTHNCKSVTADELADLYLMHHPDESPSKEGNNANDNASYELRLALRDMIKLVIRTFGDNAIHEVDQKRIDAADAMLKKHSSIYDVWRTGQSNKDDAVAEIERRNKLLENNLKLGMRLNRPGISEREQEETWQDYKRRNNL